MHFICIQLHFVFIILDMKSSKQVPPDGLIHERSRGIYLTRCTKCYMPYSSTCMMYSTSLHMHFTILSTQTLIVYSNGQLQLHSLSYFNLLLTGRIHRGKVNSVQCNFSLLKLITYIDEYAAHILMTNAGEQHDRRLILPMLGTVS